jgi:hypothetical protein
MMIDPPHVQSLNLPEGLGALWDDTEQVIILRSFNPMFDAPRYLAITPEEVRLLHEWVEKNGLHDR